MTKFLNWIADILKNFARIMAVSGITFAIINDKLTLEKFIVLIMAYLFTFIPRD